MIHIVREVRGLLGVVEFSDLPFVPRRTFWIADVPPDGTRGHHAHHTCRQMIVPLVGSVDFAVTTRDGFVRSGELGTGSYLDLPPYHWIVMSNFTHDAVVLVYCSEPYLEDDYIRSFEDFLSAS